MQIVKIISYVLLTMTFLTGCENTIHGFGKDLEKNGNEIQKSTHDEQ